MKCCVCMIWRILKITCTIYIYIFYTINRHTLLYMAAIVSITSHLIRKLAPAHLSERETMWSDSPLSRSWLTLLLTPRLSEKHSCTKWWLSMAQINRFPKTDFHPAQTPYDRCVSTWREIPVTDCFVKLIQYAVPLSCFSIAYCATNEISLN